MIELFAIRSMRKLICFNYPSAEIEREAGSLVAFTGRPDAAAHRRRERTDGDGRAAVAAPGGHREQDGREHSLAATIFVVAKFVLANCRVRSNSGITWGQRNVLLSFVLMSVCDISDVIASSLESRRKTEVANNELRSGHASSWSI